MAHSSLNIQPLVYIQCSCTTPRKTKDQYQHHYFWKNSIIKYNVHPIEETTKKALYQSALFRTFGTREKAFKYLLSKLDFDVLTNDCKMIFKFFLPTQQCIRAGFLVVFKARYSFLHLFHSLKALTEHEGVFSKWLNRTGKADRERRLRLLHFYYNCSRADIWPIDNQIIDYCIPAYLFFFSLTIFLLHWTTT